MNKRNRTRLLLALSGFVALPIFLPATFDMLSSGWPSTSSERAGEADLGIAVRDIAGSEAATITSSTSERIWSQSSSRGRFSIPVGDFAFAALLLAGLLVATVAASIMSVGTAGLAANTSDPRAPPQLLQLT